MKVSSVLGQFIVSVAAEVTTTTTSASTTTTTAQQCISPNGLKNGECVECLDTERIDNFECVPCGEHQLASFSMLDCNCRVGYPADRDDAGVMICLELAFNEVYIDSTVQTCEDRQYPSVEKTSCLTCGDDMIPQFSDTNGWFCLVCSNYYETNGQLTCVDDECTDGRSVFDLNTKACVQCEQYEFLNEAGDACESCPSNEYLTTDYQCLPCPDNQVSFYGRCFSCNPSEYIQLDGDVRTCSTCPTNSVPDSSGTACVDCGTVAVVVAQQDGTLICQECRGASIRVNDVCQPCEEGQVAIENECTECTGASLPATDGTSCVQCDTNEVAI